MKTIPSGSISRLLILLNIVVASVYFSWWLRPNNIGNPWLYGLLFFGEIYHILTAYLFWSTIYPGKIFKFEKRIGKYLPSVDVFITVAGEPVEVVRQTALAAKRMDYPNHQVYILNDGFALKKDNWRQIRKMSEEIKVGCITRQTNSGAKAGNINNGLRQTSGEIVVIFDADMVPHADFLQQTIPYLQDSKVGFIQTPQYYKNFESNDVSRAAWDQQKLFFGAIMEGKSRNNAAFICGTNVAIRRTALEAVGGMNEKNIAEDFLTSLYIHEKGWKSVYINKVLAEGLAPEDLLSYSKQQLRWARGSLEVLFSHNPIFKKGLTWRQKLEYISSGLFYLNGLIVLIDLIMPLLFLFLGWQPVNSTTTSFAIYFIPFMVLMLYTQYLVTAGEASFQSMSFTHSSWTIHIQALISVLLNQKMSFSVTPKLAQQGNFIFLAFPHMFYIILTIAGSWIGILREGVNPSVVTNIAWALFNVSLFIPFIAACANWGSFFRMSQSKPKYETTF